MMPAVAVAPEELLRNRLLGALPPEDYERARSHLELVHYAQRQVLIEPEEPIRHVYFPMTMVASIVNLMDEAKAVEVGTVGCEGMVGLPLFLGDDRSPLRAFAQVPGMAARMKADAFASFASVPGALHQVLLRYTQAFLTQVAQSAACNGAHLVQERCARWLLMTHDRAEGDAFPLTHEFLAFMLSVRRPGVTIAMRALQDLGLVRYVRGWVEIADRAGLERASCACYRVVRAHTERLLPPSRRR
ncbi:MAG TPA: Crp/Fnr family transcriptional regulator [Gemmatimonadaceae bacterium]|nr:Crp/Fnr family transcriptional regulator [Gemmatimonadaceae bacterium]